MNWLTNLFSGAAKTDWEENALILDVRSPGEFASGHIEGALNLPLDRFEQSHGTAAPDKSQQIVVYCRSGARSNQALQILRGREYQNAINGGSVDSVARRTGRPIVR